MSRTPHTGVGAISSIVVVPSIVVGALFIVGCTIRPDAEPRPLPTVTTVTTVDDAAPGNESTGDARIYLLARSEPGQQRKLRAVTRNVGPTASDLFGALWAGPSQSELDRGLTSVIPTGSDGNRPRLARFGDSVTLDLPAEVNQLTSETLALAVAQIVFTASGLPDVQSVNLLVEGVARAWPRGDGQSKTGPLSIYDFPGFVDSTQPPFPAPPPPG